MSDKRFLQELRTAAESHERNGEPRTAFLLRTAATRIDALLLKPRNAQTEHDPAQAQHLGDE